MLMINIYIILSPIGDSIFIMIALDSARYEMEIYNEKMPKFKIQPRVSRCRMIVVKPYREIDRNAKKSWSNILEEHVTRSGEHIKEAMLVTQTLACLNT